MATYKITAPDGNSYNVTAPDTASQEEILAYAKANYKGVSDGQGLGKAVKSSVIDMFRKPAMAAKDLGTNPVSMANSMPAVLGTAGGISAFPGGATIGTAAGQGIRDLSLKALNKPIPGMMQHGLELGGAALGDLTAFPAISKSYYGGEIGRLEKMAGVPPAQDIRSIPMATGQKSAGDFINEAVDSVKASGGRGQPTYWKQIKDQVDRIYEMGTDQKLTTLDKGRLKWLSGKVQEGLNASVPGRAVPSANLARSQTIPNFIGRTAKNIPSKYKIAGVGGGAIGGSLAIGEIIKKLLGG